MKKCILIVFALLAIVADTSDAQFRLFNRGGGGCSSGQCGVPQQSFQMAPQQSYQILPASYQVLPPAQTQLVKANCACSAGEMCTCGTTCNCQVKSHATLVNAVAADVALVQAVAGDLAKVQVSRAATPFGEPMQYP